MNAINRPDDIAVGARTVDVTRGQLRGEVSRQWAMRPDDQKFLSLEDLFESVSARREASFESMISPRNLKFNADRDNADVLTIEADGRQIAPTHYSFGQLCGLAKAPAPYLRGMHAVRAAFNLQTDMLQRAEDKPVKLYGESLDFTARAFTGPDYGRIYDADLVAAVQRFAGTGSR